MTRSGTAWITVFGLGRLRPAPGTWGSLPPVVLAAVLIASGFGPGAHPVVYNGALALVVLIFSGACVARGDAAEARSVRGKDPSEAVADETAGQSIALLFLPASAVTGAWAAAGTLALAFLLFRLLDIIKPWPANGLQRVRAGWGILLDDLVAGVYALGVVQVITRLLTQDVPSLSA